MKPWSFEEFESPLHSACQWWERIWWFCQGEKNQRERGEDLFQADKGADLNQWAHQTHKAQRTNLNSRVLFHIVREFCVEKPSKSLQSLYEFDQR